MAWGYVPIILALGDRVRKVRNSRSSQLPGDLDAIVGYMRPTSQKKKKIKRSQEKTGVQDRNFFLSLGVRLEVMAFQAMAAQW